jgi:hypothetical protein
VRTRYEEVGPLLGHAWCVASPDDGGANRSSVEVETWVDIPADYLASLVVPEALKAPPLPPE